LLNRQCKMKVNELSVGWAMTQSDPKAALNRVVSNIKDWSSRKSVTFSALAGERFTHGQVVKAHAYLLLVMVVMCVAGWLEGGAL